MRKKRADERAAATPAPDPKAEPASETQASVRATDDAFDPFVPLTWPKGMRAFLKSNAPSNADAAEAYQTWRQLQIEDERNVLFRSFAEKLSMPGVPEPDALVTAVGVPAPAMPAVAARAGGASVASAAPAVGKVTLYTTNKDGPRIPGKSRQWMLSNVKTMLGAHKVGRDWTISPTDFEAWRRGQDTARVRASAPDRRDADARAIAESTLAKAGLRPTKGGE